MLRMAEPPIMMSMLVASRPVTRELTSMGRIIVAEGPRVSSRGMALLACLLIGASMEMAVVSWGWRMRGERWYCTRAETVALLTVCGSGITCGAAGVRRLVSCAGWLTAMELPR